MPPPPPEREQRIRRLFLRAKTNYLLVGLFLGCSSIVLYNILDKPLIQSKVAIRPVNVTWNYSPKDYVYYYSIAAISWLAVPIARLELHFPLQALSVATHNRGSCLIALQLLHVQRAFNATGDGETVTGYACRAYYCLMAVFVVSVGVQMWLAVRPGPFVRREAVYLVQAFLIFLPIFWTFDWMAHST